MQYKQTSLQSDINSIIWDWNGTLLNDLDLSVQSINILLEKRNLPLITNGKYKEIFSFPVIEYYSKIGFDFSKEDFSVPAKEFITIYYDGINLCQLHKSAIPLLKLIKSKKLKQYILSAMEQETLVKNLAHHKVLHFFDLVMGIDNHYAVSKTEKGKLLLKTSCLDPKKTILIGDTTHDFEVSKEMGINCILIADGHQSKKRLAKTGATVLNSLEELMEYLNIL